jgi:hypothetical protein
MRGVVHVQGLQDKVCKSGQVVAKGIRIENNVYVLKENREEFHLRKHDDSWLWHRRLLSLQETLCGCRPKVLGNLRNECFCIL